jgi:hypothetical protein
MVDQLIGKDNKVARHVGGKNMVGGYKSRRIAITSDGGKQQRDKPHILDLFHAGTHLWQR